MVNYSTTDNLYANMSAITKILIVDDEKDICYFLSRSLSKRGFSTASSYSLSDAEKQLEISKPDILLLDNHLPDGRGVDFASKVSYQYPDLKIVMITAHDSPQDRAKAYNSGIDFFLSKPFTMTEINQVVDLLLGKNNV
jgi:DNA-binding response OmpR family regulator